MLDEFCPPHELQKLEEEFWTLKQVGGNNEAYTARFKQLSVLCPHLVPDVAKAIQKYTRGLPPVFRDAVSSSKPQDLEEAYRLAARYNHEHVLDGDFKAKTPAKALQAITEPTSVTNPEPTQTRQ